MILVQWNEANFPLIAQYSQKYTKQNIQKILSFRRSVSYSEEEYVLLEPWIQWASVNTCLPYAEHQIFRLGDVVQSDLPQIYEEIEKRGFKVGAISPMNAVNRLQKPSFFIPDPWTLTASDNSWSSKSLTAVLTQAVNDNASGKITLKSYFFLLINFFKFSSFKLWPTYFNLLLQSRNKKWCKALFLDLFLTEVFCAKHADTKPDFSSLFLNGLAHIQHHYLLSSEFQKTQAPIPNWYVRKHVDPFHDAVNVYDKIFGLITQLSKKNPLVIATGLSQEPYDHQIYYYRLKNHQEFLTYLGIKRFKVFPRMTRDFEIVFEDEISSKASAALLKAISLHQKNLFTIDCRGKSLFVTLSYDDEISVGDSILIEGKDILLSEQVVFVALKNGHHSGKGYVSWTDLPSDFLPSKIPHVKDLGSSILNYFTSKN